MVETITIPLGVLRANDIIGILQAYHQPTDRWIFLAELRPSTGYGARDDRRIDAWAMHCWPSERFERIAYEVKVSRSDFLSELKQPRKRRVGLLHSNSFYFITPPGIARIEEIPPECGLIEVSREMSIERGIASRKAGGWYLNYRIVAPHRDTVPPSWAFLASVVRQARDWAARSNREC